MPVYLWTGKNRKGETQKGEMEAANENAVRNHLTRLKITPVRIKKKLGKQSMRSTNRMIRLSTDMALLRSMPASPGPGCAFELLLFRSKCNRESRPARTAAILLTYLFLS